MRMRTFFLFCIVLFVANGLFAEEKKYKVAVMEIEDRNASLDIAMLENALEYLRGELAATNKFVLISKDRQRQIIKEQKKESWKECYDQNCRIQLGQALSADSVLHTSINLFGGVYTVTVELVDLAKEATVKGAKAKFDGTDKGLMQAFDKILLQIADRPVTFDPGTMQTKEVKGMEIGTVSLSALPSVKVESASLGDVESKTKIADIAFPDIISNDVDPDVLVLYDKALKADKKGKENPDMAVLAWTQLKMYSKGNPYIKQADQRIAEWKEFSRMNELGQRYKKAVAMDPYGKFFPDKVIAIWRNLMKDAGGTAYVETATKRIAVWNDFTAKVKAYKEKQDAFSQQHGKDIDKLVKVLPLDLFNEGQKRSMLIRYLEAYAPFYGIEDIDMVLDRLPDRNLSKRLRELVFNELLTKEMYQKCEGGDAGACYISASLKEVESPKEALNLFVNACKNGVVNACIKAGTTRYEEGSTEAVEYFSIACSWESPQGCNSLAFLTEIGFGVERFKDLATSLYKKSCQMGNQPSCLMYNNIESTGYSSDQAAAIIEKRAMQKKVDDALGTEGNDLAREVESRKKGDFQKTTRTVKVEETYRPYLWTGIGLIIGGVAVAVGGGVAFYYLADDEYSTYERWMSDAAIMSGINGGTPQDVYIAKARKAWDNAQMYEALEYSFIGVGGAAVVTGIVLAALPPEKREIVKEVSFAPIPGGFMVAAGFEF